MLAKHFEFYIDESGSFMDDIPEKMQHPEEMSLVGGYLYDPAIITNDYITAILPHKVHCCQEYKKYYIDALEKVYLDGGRFVVFENKERIKVVNGDVTYLNIISEGLVQLLSYLPLVYPNEKVDVRIVVATRKAMSGGTGIIQYKEYITRLSEKLFMAIHRSKAAICDYRLDFEDARYSKRHDLADIVCNTYMTRNRRNKFSDEDRARISEVFNSNYIFSVFEDATIGYLKQLLSETRYSEMMYQICTLPKLTGVTDLRNRLLMQIIKSSSTERKAYFSYISLQIGLYNNRRMFSEGIRFAENYKQYILCPLLDFDKIPRSEINFWIFDTDFFILTMYDHIGNASMCEKYLEACNSNISSINHSWEHIDYYFAYRIRELNCLMGRFDFDSVIRKANNLIDIFSSAKDLFGMIETYDGTTNTLQSELLGKVYGVKLEAYINCLVQRPNLFDEALEISTRAIGEFVTPSDFQRQYQYRCSLMLTAKKNTEALQCLLRSYNLNITDDRVFDKFIELAYTGRSASDAFALWHYTNVMVAMEEEGNSIGSKMKKAMNDNRACDNELRDTGKTGYPWNMVLWNISKWFRLTGSLSAADGYYQRALSITRSCPDQVTMYSFGICMIADMLLWQLKNGKQGKNNIQKEILRTLKEFQNMAIPESMKMHFAYNDHNDLESNLSVLSTIYLR